MSRTNTTPDRMDILVAENLKLRRNAVLLVEQLAEERIKREALEAELVATHADLVLLRHKLEAKQMHLDAMLQPEAAKAWHARYLREVLG